MVRKSKKIHFPKLRIADLVARGGGIAQDHAIAKAMAGMETLRETCMEAIESAILSMETALYKPGHKTLTTGEMAEVLKLGDRIVNLAGTFGCLRLEIAAKSLCDVASGLIGLKLYDAPPILVHVQALRLLSPRNTEISDEASDLVLAELARVLEHFNLSPVIVADDTELSDLADNTSAA